MIPKIIHFCWLSDEPYPKEIETYIHTWKQKLPDYEIIKWDFTNIDKNKFKWVSDAYDRKKYAFAADYIRVYALYNYGGIYFDSDVEVLKSFDDLLTHKYFMCHEYKKKNIEAAIIGVEKHHPLFKKMLEYYDNRSFVDDNGVMDLTPIPNIMYDIIVKDFCMEEIESPNQIDDSTDDKLCVLPYDYFSPKSSSNGYVHKTERTYAIHQFSNTWFPKYYIIERKFWHTLHLKNLRVCLRFVNLFKHGSLRGRLFD